jgi:NAD(P)-dependent dehydrogenase (short-subunit alcohol dehydrogenase family)
MKLTDKVVVITGAGSGIGRATALRFSQAGANICACDVSAERLATLGRELGPRAMLAETVDVSDRAQMAAFAERVHAKTPAADIVVNNAGVGVGGAFVDTKLDDWDWLLGINLRGVVHGCHFFIPKMVERGIGGQVINVSSVLGVYPAPYNSAYVASKFAVLGLSQSLRAELAPHKIGVTAICPGMIATAIVEDSRVSSAIAARREQVAKVFKKKGAPPSVVADAIFDAVRTNPAVRPVGRDGWVMWALSKVSPQAVARLTAGFSRRMAE